MTLLPDKNLKITLTSQADPASLWQETPARARAFCLYDVPASSRAEAFAIAIDRASQVLIARQGGRLVSCLWFQTVADDAQTAAVHALRLANLPPETTRAALRQLPYHDLMALIPMPWFHSIGHALAAGFRKIAVLRKACYLADYCQTVHGALLHFSRCGQET